MDDEREGSPWVAWCSGVIVLLGLYVGAYAILVRPIPLILKSEARYGPSDSQIDRIGQVIFVPINAIDRRFRPSVWKDGAAIRRTAPLKLGPP